MDSMSTSKRFPYVLFSDLSFDIATKVSAKKSVPCHPIEAAGKQLVGPASDTIVVDLRNWIVAHDALRHPVFDYIETTAQAPEFTSFVRSELTDGIADDAGRPTLCHIAAPLERNGVNGNMTRGDTPVSTYLQLLRQAQLHLEEHEALHAMSVSQEDGPPRSIESAPCHLDQISSAMRPIIDVASSLHYHKVLRGCLRIGMCPENFNFETISVSAEKSIDAAIQATLTGRSEFAIDNVKGLICFLDETVNYYDKLFNDMLWS